MKKSLIMSALLCAFSVPAAYAQSNVTLYGVVDGAIAVSKVKGGDTRIGFDNGIWAGSRFGIRGTEDLGSATASALSWSRALRPSAAKR